jgi:hypothetical protein
VGQLDLVYLRLGGDGLLVGDRVPLAESLGVLAKLRGRRLIRHLGSAASPASSLPRP